MIKIGIRELTRNFSGYLKEVKKGERIVVMEHNKAVADIFPHQLKASVPGWKRKHYKLEGKGKLASDIVTELREDRM